MISGMVEQEETAESTGSGIVVHEEAAVEFTVTGESTASDRVEHAELKTDSSMIKTGASHKINFFNPKYEDIYSLFGHPLQGPLIVTYPLSGITQHEDSLSLYQNPLEQKDAVLISSMIAVY